ncbi:glutathione S-transferase [Variovorax boronicumulans]|uniref:glutathione S-transferase n=1 Tax=Variovorax boronicumulans TaxID=436515 RepID=UPI00339821DC
MTSAITTALPVLYSFRRCPYAMRARLALVAGGAPCELREIVLRDKPAEMLAASPKGTVPVLVTAEGTVIEQSLDVMLWALRRNDPLRWLQPEVGTLDDMLALVALCDNDFKPQLDRYKYPGRFAEAEGAARERGAMFLRGLESRLSVSAHLAGAHATLADAALMPFVRQFAMVDMAWFDAQPWPRLQSWLSGWLACDVFARAMHKYAPWKAGETGIDFPPDWQR